METGAGLLTFRLRAVNRMQMANAQTFTTNCRGVTESLGEVSGGDCQFLKKELSGGGAPQSSLSGSVTKKVRDRLRAGGLRASWGRAPLPLLPD